MIIIMFDKSSLIKLLNIFVFVSFFISSILGFIEVSNNFNASNLILSLNSILFPICLIAYDYTYGVALNIRSLLYAWNAVLMMGISSTILGLSVTIIIFSCLLFYIYIFSSNNEETETLQ